MSATGDNHGGEQSTGSTVRTPATVHPANGLRVQMPDTFSGNRSQFKPFIVQCEMYMILNQDKFAHDTTKVLFMCTFLRGSALDCIQPHLEDFVANKHSTGVVTKQMKENTKVVFQTLSGFYEAMGQVFGDIESGRNAVRNLQNIKQRGSASSYAADFQRFSVRTTWGDDALCDEFYKGLKDNLKDDITRMDNRPTSLKDMIAAAIRIDNRNYERQLERKGHYIPNNNKPNRSRWPEPMELDAVQRTRKPFKKNGPPRKTLSKDEAQRRKERGLCYECGLPGHMASSHRQDKPWKGKRQANVVERREFCVAYRIQNLTSERMEEASQAMKGKHRRDNVKLGKQAVYVVEGWPETGRDWEETEREMETFIATAGSATSETPSNISSRTLSEDAELREQISQQLDQHLLHGQIHWTACCEDQCPIHYGAKNTSGHWPSQRRNTRQKNDNREIAVIGQHHHLKAKVSLGDKKLEVMIDSGAQGNFIDFDFVNRHEIPIQVKKNPYQITTIDGKNAGIDGWVTKETAPMEWPCLADIRNLSRWI